ncbi:hypothetical protein TD95_004109 [Thielaviopsis punctulata]|uniref:Maltose/galactoside acetyltransferase domain-containing protein n=1 Tax=Thielaviopsis punctulata TaxID=72032 RepID=A0A0F4ZMD8_9PEZI|nr:hypothetical protein TD95_004109 [Thielaviopsis punctulata]
MTNPEIPSPEINRQRMLAGELYYAFAPDLIQSRARCAAACRRYNQAEAEATRRERVEMMNQLLGDDTPLPLRAATEEEDDALLANYPWVQSPVTMDYGTNVVIGPNAFINFNAVFLDTCRISIGARTLVGPNCSFYAASHPLDPAVRNGTSGPENGAPISVGEDCWIGGNCIILPGVTIGRGSTVGAGSVVTKDVPEMVVVAGNPARIVRRL